LCIVFTWRFKWLGLEKRLKHIGQSTPFKLSTILLNDTGESRRGLTPAALYLLLSLLSSAVFAGEVVSAEEPLPAEEEL